MFLGFIIRRGTIDPMMKQLQHNLRNVMYPNTAANLNQTNNKSLKDFTSVAGIFGVTHLIMLTSTQKANYLKIAKSPSGPTITFRLAKFSLSSQVMKSQRKKISINKDFHQSPLLVLNGFQSKFQNQNNEIDQVNTQQYRHITAMMLQSLFPQIDVLNLNLKNCRRVMLFSMTDKDIVEFRHYKIQTRIRGVNKRIKKFMNNGNLKKIQKFDDISQLVIGGGAGGQGYVSSDSQAQDLPGSLSTLPADYNGKKKNSDVAVKLHEIGPRLTLKLIKIEEGLCDGNIVMHSQKSKSKQEQLETKKKIALKRQLKLERKKKQQEDIKLKESLKKKVRFKDQDGDQMKN